MQSFNFVAWKSCLIEEMGECGERNQFLWLHRTDSGFGGINSNSNFYLFIYLFIKFKLRISKFKKKIIYIYAQPKYIFEFMEVEIQLPSIFVQTKCKEFISSREQIWESRPTTPDAIDVIV